MIQRGLENIEIGLIAYVRISVIQMLIIEEDAAERIKPTLLGQELKAKKLKGIQGSMATKLNVIG